MIFRICTWGLLLFGPASASAGGEEPDVRTGEPVTVTASRISLFPLTGLRECAVIDRRDIEAMPSMSVADALRLAGGLDVRPRGNAGVQADFSIRGSSFEQVLVLVNGMRVSDPQTGHHNADLPVALEDVDRIEVLQGPASSLYGSDGFGGVVNVVTRSGRVPSGRLAVRGGSFGGRSVTASRSAAAGPWAGRMTAGWRASDGYAAGMEYEATELTHRSTVEWGRAVLDAEAGWTLKRFGAAGFYAPYRSRETTAALLFGAGLGWQAGPGTAVSGRVFARRHDDCFTLDRSRPAWYRNRHRTGTAGAEFSIDRRLGSAAEAVLGFEALSQNLASSNLGNHERSIGAVFGEAVVRPQPGSALSLGFRFDGGSDRGGQFNPAIGFVRDMTGGWSGRLSAGRAFRPPNFTEMYYRSPTDLGDPDLRPERAWCVEAGAFGHGLEVTLFRRNERDRIEWAAEKKGDVWKAKNAGRSTVDGVSAGFRSRWGAGLSLRTWYTWLDRDRKDPVRWIYKYGNEPVRHLWTSSAVWAGPGDWRMSVYSTFKRRGTGGESGLFLDGRVERGFGRFRPSIETGNLLNSRFRDIETVPTEGRTVSVSMEWILAGPY
jgi:vitamin B12 transporter